MFDIRSATAADASEIAEIYNEAVENSTAIWNVRTTDANERAQWIQSRAVDECPVLVATEDAHVVGYATYGPFRPHDGYRHTVELSLYVHADRRGRGIGRKLLAALLDRAHGGHIHAMVAGIEARNTASIALHKTMGFQESGTLPQVGQKFGRWLDLTFLTYLFDQQD